MTTLKFHNIKKLFFLIIFLTISKTIYIKKELKIEVVILEYCINKENLITFINKRGFMV